MRNLLLLLFRQNARKHIITEQYVLPLQKKSLIFAEASECVCRCGCFRTLPELLVQWLVHGESTKNILLMIYEIICFENSLSYLLLNLTKYFQFP